MSDQTLAGSAPAGPASAAAPPRKSALKRILLIHLAGLLVLAILWCWWAVAAQRLWDDTIARRRAAGRPVTLADLNARQRPFDKNNAAVLYMQAAREIAAFYRPPPRATTRPPALQIIHKVRQLLEQARSCKHSDLVVPYTLPDPSYTDAHVRPLRQLIDFVSTDFLVQRESGNHAGALDRLGDLLRIGQALESRSGNLDWALTKLTASTVRLLLTENTGTLCIERGPATRPASRRQATDLISRLLDVRGIQRSAVASGDVNAVQALEAVKERAPKKWLLRPMYVRDFMRLVQQCEQWQQRTRAPTFPAGELIPLTSELHRLNYAVIITYGELWAGHSLFQSLFEQIGERRIAATVLAIKLYELDHSALPSQWPDLVPRYLPELPQDPFAPGTQALRLKQTSGGLLVYSLGPNGTDEGAATFTSINYWIGAEAGSLVLPSPAATKPAPSSRQALDHQP
jgi:hypothetical protein